MTRALFASSVLAGAGLGTASAELARGVAEDWLMLGGGTGVIALVLAGTCGRHAAGAVRPPAGRRPAAADVPSVPLAPPLRPASRHGADRTPPGADIHFFKPGRRYAAFERGNGWDL